jgi:hypothetical protein
MRKIVIIQHGQRKAFDADRLPTDIGIFDAPVLENCSPECLERVNQLVTVARGVGSETREEQRARLQKTADAARGYRTYRDGDRTQLDITVKYKDDTRGTNSFEAVGETPNTRPSTGPTMDRGVPAPADANTRSLWVDPATGQYYSRSALRGLVDSNRKLFLKMMSVDLKFTNFLLNQEN